MSFPYLNVVKALVRDGRDAIIDAREKGVEPDWLEQDAAVVLAYLYDYIDQYQGSPDEATVFGQTNVDVSNPPAQPSDYWVDQLKEVTLHSLLREGVGVAQSALNQGQTQKALDDVENMLKVVRDHHLTRKRVVGLFDKGPALFRMYERIKAGERGIPFPWPTATNKTMGMWPEDLILVAGKSGIGKCLAADSRVTDPQTGVRRKISEIVEDETATVASWDRQDGVTVRSVSNWIDSGVRDCLQVSLATGRQLTLTPEHKVLTAQGWRPIGQLQVGETIGLPEKLPEPAQPQSMDPEVIDLLAILLADGSYTGHHVSVTKKSDPEVLRRARVGAQFLGGDVTETVPGRTHALVRGEPGAANPVRELLRRLGIDNTLSKNKTLPDEVYQLPDAQVARFLGVFWMCDGYVDDGGPGLVLASKDLIDGIQHLLARLGIQASVRPKPSKCDGKVFDAWRLRPYSAYHERFAELLELWGDKLERLQGLLRGRQHNPNVGSPSIGGDTVARLRRLWERRGSELTRRVADRLGRKYRIQFNSLLSEDRARLRVPVVRAFCEEMGCGDEFEWIWDSGLFWDQIVKVESAGSRQCYDLTVPSTSCFVAEDVVVHNSWIAALMALHAWNRGHRVLFGTTELSQLTIARRLYALHLGVPYGSLYRARLDPWQEKEFEEFCHNPPPDAQRFQLVGGDFDFRIETLSAAIQECNPELAILDGAYLLKTSGYARSRSDRAAQAFNELKRLAQHHKIAVATTTQMNRDAKREDLSSLSLDTIGLSDTGGWNASLALAVHQDDAMKQDNTMILKWLKCRETVIPDLEINADWDFMDFSELSRAGGGDADIDTVDFDQVPF